MKGQVLEWNNGRGYQRGLLIPSKQIKTLTNQGRALVYLLDDNLELQKNENGGNIAKIVRIKETKCIGFKD